MNSRCGILLFQIDQGFFHGGEVPFGFVRPGSLGIEVFLERPGVGRRLVQLPLECADSPEQGGQIEGRRVEGTSRQDVGSVQSSLGREMGADLLGIASGNLSLESGFGPVELFKADLRRVRFQGCPPTDRQILDGHVRRPGGRHSR